MFRNKCCVCGKTLNTNDTSKAICGECKKIAFVVSLAVIKINQSSRTRPSGIRVSDVIQIISEDNFVDVLRKSSPGTRGIVRDFTNPILRKGYLDAIKINRCFDFFEEGEELCKRAIGKSKYEKRQKLAYWIIKRFSNVGDYLRAIHSAVLPTNKRPAKGG